MNIPTKKLRTGFELPVLGLGTYGMGGRKERDPHNNDERDVQAIQAALDLGVAHIDTAELYAAGHAEELVAEALNGRDRSKLFIASKVKGDNLTYDAILQACENSLKRLKTGYLDLYLIHWFEEAFPLQDSMRALDRLVSEGLVKNIGVSNFGIAHLAEAQSHSSYKIVCDQVHYNLESREPETAGLLKYCQENDIFIVAWRPVGKGAFAKEPPAILQELSTKYQKTPSQIAINWLTSQSHVATIAKSSNLEHLQENLEAVGWAMEPEDVERLRQEYPNQQAVSDSVPLE